MCLPWSCRTPIRRVLSYARMLSAPLIWYLSKHRGTERQLCTECRINREPTACKASEKQTEWALNAVKSMGLPTLSGWLFHCSRTRNSTSSCSNIRRFQSSSYTKSAGLWHVSHFISTLYFSCSLSTCLMYHFCLSLDWQSLWLSRRYPIDDLQLIDQFDLTINNAEIWLCNICGFDNASQACNCF